MTEALHVCSCSRVASCCFVSPLLVFRKQTRIFPASPSTFHPCFRRPPAPTPTKLILVLNVCSGGRSGQVRDSLLSSPLGHLQLHLIQMPICSTQIGRGWSRPACLADLFEHFARAVQRCVIICVPVCACASSSLWGFVAGRLSLVHL